jgi:hypothetical protein
MFLGKGMSEGNPFVSRTLSFAHTPWVGLALTKLTATLIGNYCYSSGRMTLLRRANVGYSLVVGWNLVAITAAAFVHR